MRVSLFPGQQEREGGSLSRVPASLRPELQREQHELLHGCHQEVDPGHPDLDAQGHPRPGGGAGEDQQVYGVSRVQGALPPADPLHLDTGAMEYIPKQPRVYFLWHQLRITDIGMFAETVVCLCRAPNNKLRHLTTKVGAN